MCISVLVGAGTGQAGLGRWGRVSSAFSVKGEAGEEKEQSLRVTPSLCSLRDPL